MPQHQALSKGAVAVITGGASGIGLAAARGFAAFGMKLVLADLSQDALDRAAAQLPDAELVTVPTDVSKIDEVNRLKDRAYAAFGAVDVLMNNAGTSPGGGPFDHYERWQRVLAVNLWGHQRRPRLRPGNDRPEDAGRNRQHRLQAGDHLPAGRHRLQHYEGRGEGADRRSRAFAAQRRGLPDHSALAGAGLDLHRHDRARTHREAARLVDPGASH